MTEKRANEILRTKYPEATIYNGKRFGGSCSGRMVVVFKKGGKCYDYYCNSYAKILERLGFDILYKRELIAIQKEIEKLENELKAGGKIADGFDVWFNRAEKVGDIMPFTDNEVASKRADIESYKLKISKSFIE